MMCSNWQTAEISPGSYEYVTVAGNSDSFLNGSSKPNAPIDDTPDSQMFSCNQLHIFHPGWSVVCFIHLQNFVATPKQHYFPDFAIPPPAC
jgi:hypothetical protein